MIYSLYLFPIRLKEARIKKGLTQLDMANKLGISRPSYTNYELGRIYPNFEHLIQIALELDISIDFLVGRS